MILSESLAGGDIIQITLGIAAFTLIVSLTSIALSSFLTVWISQWSNILQDPEFHPRLNTHRHLLLADIISLKHNGRDDDYPPLPTPGIKIFLTMYVTFTALNNQSPCIVSKCFLMFLFDPATVLKGRPDRCPKSLWLTSLKSLSW